MLCSLPYKPKKRDEVTMAPNEGRLNITLLDMLGTLQPDQKQNWKKYIVLVYAYNCTPHETTKAAPFELMFERKPKLPIDTLFDIGTEQKYNNSLCIVISLTI